MIILNKAKNYIINGGMDFWQRNTTFTSIASAYCADRFKYDRSGTFVQNVTRDTDVPTTVQAGFPFQYSANITTTTASAVLSAGQYMQFLQSIEAQILAPLVGRNAVFSFWVKSSVLGTFAVGFRNGVVSNSYVSSFTINTVNTWEKKTVSIYLDPSVSFGTGISSGLLVTISFGAGTTYQAPSLNTWNAGNFFGHSSSNNGMATNGTIFKITGLQLEEGIESSNFERAGGNIASELRLCQRYFEAVGFTTSVPLGCGVWGAGSGSVYSAMKVTKRTIPTVSAVGSFSFDDGGIGGTGTYTSTTASVDALRIGFSGGGGQTRPMYMWPANATSGINADAEL